MERHYRAVLGQVEFYHFVIPARAGNQLSTSSASNKLDSRLRGNDVVWEPNQTKLEPL